MMPSRAVEVVVAAVVAMWPAVSADAQTLAVQGGQFTLNGQPRFLVFVSYFDGVRRIPDTLDSTMVHAKFAGDETIVMVPFFAEQENGKTDVVAGDIGYYPGRQTLCLFYGRTTPFGEVSYVARVRSNLDGLAKNVRLAPNGKFRWHWDPKFHTSIRDTDLRQQRMEACTRNLSLNFNRNTLLSCSATPSDAASPRAAGFRVPPMVAATRLGATSGL